MPCSVVEFFPSRRESYHCGYCGGRGNQSTGMWAHALTVHHYQSLIDRGWRRSGLYCYKPDMGHMCCPSYTIRCEALNFRPSRSQKKVMKRVNRFLRDGTRRACKAVTPLERKMDYDEEEEDSDDEEEGSTSAGGGGGGEHFMAEKAAELVSSKGMDVDIVEPEKDPVPVPPSVGPRGEGPSLILCAKTKVTPRPGAGRDLTRPPRLKAKILRQLRKQEKLLSAPSSSSKFHLPKVKKETPTSFRSLIDEPLCPPKTSPSHSLTLSLIPCHELLPDDSEMLLLEHQVYQAYQVAVHGDSLSKCTLRQFKRFLVKSPLIAEKGDSEGNAVTFGTFHQQYWLDKQRLIAVAVLDVLPKCVSSVYFFYDPEFAFLALGTYSALREVALSQDLHERFPNLEYYYMGYYIHSCPKMRYKGAYHPSDLLCPETYIWRPIKESIPLLDVFKYSRLNPDPNAIDLTLPADMTVDQVRILYKRRSMSYGSFKRSVERETGDAPSDEEDVKFYLSLIGAEAAKSILLFRE